MIKIEIKNRFTGKIIFEYSKENNTISDTVKEFIRKEIESGKSYADLRSADLRSANLSSADLRSANLSYADLRSADLRSADLRSADLSSADLRSANLRSANLSYAELSSAELSYADLRSANLSYADLSYANLSYANLSSANLSYANLRSANLSSADLDKRCIQVACIGSAKRMTTYCLEDDIVWCGCFKGTLDEFEKQVLETHASNERHLKEYTGFINYVKSLK